MAEEQDVQGRVEVLCEMMLVVSDIHVRGSFH